MPLQFNYLYFCKLKFQGHKNKSKSAYLNAMTSENFINNIVCKDDHQIQVSILSDYLI